MREALVFTVSGEALALPVSVIDEVVRPVWPRRLPRAPAGCVGAIDVRGQLVALVRLGTLLALEGLTRPADLAAYLSARMILVVRLQGLVALVVDQVIDVVEFRPSAQPARGPLPSSLLLGTCEAGRRRAVVLDPAALMTARRGRLLERALGAVGT